MATYDPKIIQAYADDLYSRATTIVVMNVLFFAVLGGIGGFVAFRGAGSAVLLLLGGLVGYYFGSQRAFQRKLQAQSALCQVEIERNTRSFTVAPRQLAETSGPGFTQVERPQVTHDERLGTCPNCTRTIPLASSECPRCTAVFNEGSAWKVQPL